MDSQSTKKSLVLIVILCLFAACAKPVLYGKTQQITTVREAFNVGYDKVFEAAKWALEREGYSIEEESKTRGTIVTDWTPSTPDSNYVEVFGRRDYGTTGSYYHLDLAIYQQGGQIQVVVRSIAKSLVSRLHSTGFEEKKVLARISNYLQGKDIDMTNLGVAKP